jgi:hypothetical protein
MVILFSRDSCDFFMYQPVHISDFERRDNLRIIADFQFEAAD